MNVEPAGNRPARPSSNGTCALSATATIAPGRGSDRDQRGRLGHGRDRAVGGGLHRAVERGGDRAAGLAGLLGEHSGRRRDPQPRLAGEPVVERPLQAGDAELVGAVIAGPDLLEHVRGGRPDPPEQRLGERPARREQLLALLEHRAGQVVDLRTDLLVVGPAQRDHRDEGVRRGLLHTGDDVGPVDLEHAGERGRQPRQVGHLARLHADGHHIGLGEQRCPGVVLQRGPLRQHVLDLERGQPGRGQLRVQVLRLPLHAPGVLGAHQRKRAVVPPRRADPGQLPTRRVRGGRVVVILLGHRAEGRGELGAVAERRAEPPERARRGAAVVGVARGAGNVAA